MQVDYRHLVSRIDADEPTGACLVALLGGEVVATLGLRLREPGGYINSLYVEPTFQGKGIGRRLVLRAAELSYRYGKTTLGLAVHHDNAPARKLYESLGFRPHDWGHHDGYTRYVAFLPLNS